MTDNTNEPTHSDVEFMVAYRRLINDNQSLTEQCNNLRVEVDAYKKAIDVAEQMADNPHLNSVEVSQNTATYQYQKSVHVHCIKCKGLIVIQSPNFYRDGNIYTGQCLSCNQANGDDKLRAAYMAGCKHVTDMSNSMFRDYWDTPLDQIVLEFDKGKVNQYFAAWKAKNE